MYSSSLLSFNVLDISKFEKVGVGELGGGGGVHSDQFWPMGYTTYNQ